MSLSGFADQDRIPVADIVRALDRLPSFHLEGLREIVYAPEWIVDLHAEPFPPGSPVHIKGRFIQQQRQIVFYGFDTPDQFFHVLYHEIGHYVFFQVIGSKVKKRWVTGIYPNSFCATAYGTRNASEDFAESYACYVRDPDYLRHFPEKHAFMRDCVFSGRPETLKEKSVATERR